MICGAKNVVEHYGKRVEILHGCPFEGHPTLFGRIGRLAELAMPFSTIILVQHIKKLETYFALFVFLDFRTVCAILIDPIESIRDLSLTQNCVGILLPSVSLTKFIPESLT